MTTFICHTYQWDSKLWAWRVRQEKGMVKGWICKTSDFSHCQLQSRGAQHIQPLKVPDYMGVNHLNTHSTGGMDSFPDETLLAFVYLLTWIRKAETISYVEKTNKNQELCPCFHLSEIWISLPSGEISGVLIVWISKIQDFSPLQIIHAAIDLCFKSEQEDMVCTLSGAVLSSPHWHVSSSVTSIRTTHKKHPHIHFAGMVWPLL